MIEYYIYMVLDDKNDNYPLREAMETIRNDPNHKFILSEFKNIRDLIRKLSDKKKCGENEACTALIDLEIPDFRPDSTIQELRQQFPGLSVIVIADIYDVGQTVDIIKKGAQDCLALNLVNSDILYRMIPHAVERNRFQNELSRRASALQALYDTTLAINAQTDLTTLLNAICQRAAELVGVPMGALYLYNPENGKLRLSYGYQLPNKYIGYELNPGEGASGIAFKTHDVVCVDDYLRWEHRATIFETREFRRVISIPLIVKDKVIGVINVSDSQVGSSFSENDVWLVKLFADQASIAVENARLIDSERRQSAELLRTNNLMQMLNHAASVMEANFNPEQLMQVIGDELRELGFNLQFVLRDSTTDEFVIRYVAMDSRVLAIAEKITGLSLLGLKVSRELVPLRGQFTKDPQRMVRATIPYVPEPILNSVLNMLGVTARTSAIYIPLVMKDQLIGAMAVWSEDLHEEDLTAFTVFANQVSAAFENVRLYDQVQKLAIHDDLSGLYNRRGFYELVDKQKNHMRRTHETALLVFIDVDHLKWINDTFGHQYGDQALIQVAEILKNAFRTSDIVARIGGDEFAVLAVVSGEQHQYLIRKRILDLLHKANQNAKRPFELSLSMGIVLWSPEDPPDLEAVLVKADALMYEDKQNKRREN